MEKDTRIVNVGNVEIGGGKPLALIAGPCVIESEEHALSMAERLADLTTKLDIPYIFKASFDKANRSSVGSFRGPGLYKGLGILAKIKEKIGLPVLSDIHSAEQISTAAEILDVLQIPAFLCRQTDILVAAGKSGKPVNVKKGQFMAPGDMANAVGKIESTCNREIILTERGSSFGYNNLITDMRGLAIMRDLGTPVVFDATHSAQSPGGQGTRSGGDREMAMLLARSATAAGIDGLFLEVHDAPDSALCDGPNMIALDRLEQLLRQIVAIDETVRG